MYVLAFEYGSGVSRGGGPHLRNEKKRKREKRKKKEKGGRKKEKRIEEEKKEKKKQKTVINFIKFGHFTLLFFKKISQQEF